MYEAYWKLRDKPFRNTPDPHYFYFSRQHEEAITRLLYAITEGQGAMMLTGEYGCGKTLLTRTLVDELDPDRFELAHIPYPNLSATELLEEVLRQFGYNVDGLGKVQLLAVLREFLLENHAKNKHTIVLVDEAQMVLDRMTLEEIRLLLNLQQERKFYLTLILAGQPELRMQIEDMPQLLQRLSIRYHIGPLNAEDSVRYLGHRLRVGGARRDLFTGGAVRMLVDAGEGVPRRLNNLADMSLLLGFGMKSSCVDESIVRRVVNDMNS